MTSTRDWTELSQHHHAYLNVWKMMLRKKDDATEERRRYGRKTTLRKKDDATEERRRYGRKMTLRKKDDATEERRRYGRKTTLQKKDDATEERRRYGRKTTPRKTKNGARWTILYMMLQVVKKQSFVESSGYDDDDDRLISRLDAKCSSVLYLEVKRPLIINRTLYGKLWSIFCKILFEFSIS